MLWAFVPVAVVVTLTPGPATTLVVRSTLRGGRRAALRTTVGNATGIAGWALLSAAGISALVAASEVAFSILKLAGVAVLVWLGVQALRGRRRVDRSGGEVGAHRKEFRDGLITSAANPKLAVVFDFVWFLTLAMLITRAKRALVDSRVGRRIEQAAGVVLLGLAGRLALEHR